MPELTPPHGGVALDPRLVPTSQKKEAIENAKSLKKISISSREKSDVLMFSMGAYTPLCGFMTQKDWQGTCLEMKLENGTFWPIPITLSTNKEVADTISIGEEVALLDEETDDVCATITVEDKYIVDKNLECKNVFLTSDIDHPGVAKVFSQGDVNLGGKVSVLDEGTLPQQFETLYLKPQESREKFSSLGWRKVSAFQTRNPMHRSHEYLVKIAAEITDGVFIHQVLGKLKPGDIPAEVRTSAIQVMIDNYFKPGNVIQAGYPIEMRYAGPREALFHALIRQNFGCSHLIVGRDHAGVGNYYGPFDAQNIFDELWDDALITKPLKIDITFFCKKCYGMATGKTCPHDPRHHINVSGTEQREMLSKGISIPPEFSRPEVVEVLRTYYEALK